MSAVPHVPTLDEHLCEIQDHVDGLAINLNDLEFTVMDPVNAEERKEQGKVIMTNLYEQMTSHTFATEHETHSELIGALRVVSPADKQWLAQLVANE